MIQDVQFRTVIEHWCEAVTSGDLVTVRNLVTDDVEFAGPRGTGTGADVVIEWVKRSQIHIEALAITQEGPRYRAECAATWPDGDVQGRTLPIITTLEFEHVDGQISVIRRFDHPGGQGEA